MSEHQSLAEALAAFQAELPRVGKGNTAKVSSDKGSYSYKYADLADVSQAVLPVLGKFGLSFTSRPTVSGDRFVLAYELLHAGGESRTGEYPLPANGTPQAIGSAITYARRYALCAITGIAPDGDDDGAAATQQHEAERAEEQQIVTDAFADEIRLTRTVEDLTNTGKAIRRSLSSKSISRAQYDHLVQQGAARRAELEQAADKAFEEVSS